MITGSYNKGRDRFYEVEGHDKDLPSVTTYLGAIAKPALTTWSAKVERGLVADIAKEVRLATLDGGDFAAALDTRLKQTKYACNTKLTEAGDIGTAIHEWVEWETKRRLAGIPAGDEPSVPPEGEFAKNAWKAWAEEYKFEPVMTEQRVYSIKYGFAGTTDVVCYVTPPGQSRRLAVGDYKSSSGVYYEHLLQIAAYRAGLHEMGHFTEEQLDGIVVKLPKKAKDTFRVALVDATDLDQHFKTFLSVRDLWVGIKKFEADKRYR